MDKKEAFKIAGIYMMINIGAGFTSGQEILQFFSAYGWLSFFSAIITFAIMLYAGESLLDAGWLCKDNKKISVFEYIGGKYIGTTYNIVIPFLLYGSYIIMIAGSGALIEQYFISVPNMVGRFIVCVLSVLSIFSEFNKIAKYLGYLGKIVAGIIFLLSIVVILKGIPNFFNVSNFINSYPVKIGSDTFYGAGILYGGMIVLASCQFLFDTGRSIEKRNTSIYGAFYGTIGFVGVILMINLAILLYFDKVYNLPIVTLYFAEQISPVLALFLTVLIFIAMYSASTISLWSVVNVVKKKFDIWNKRYVLFVILVGGFGFLLSSIPFNYLVNIIYPINGMFGVILMILIIIQNRKNAYQIHKDKNL